jgi:hypothetical protein
MGGQIKDCAQRFAFLKALMKLTTSGELIRFMVLGC